MKAHDLISALSAYDPDDQVGIETVVEIGFLDGGQPETTFEDLPIVSVSHNNSGFGPRIVLSTTEYLQVRQEPLTPLDS